MRAKTDCTQERMDCTRATKDCSPGTNLCSLGKTLGTAAMFASNLEKSVP